MSNPIDQCRYCQKSELSLLLLRPSPIALHSDLQAPGSSQARADQALVAPLIPAGLTESRPVLRLLRAGYVHLYIPKDDQWVVYSVTDRGEVLAQDHPSFGNAQMQSCRRDGHNASGFKLVRIPQAHELMGQSIWLAFSANLWSNRLKNQNKANPQAMVEVKLGSAAAPAFKPDAASLKRQVLECNVTVWRLPRVDGGIGPMFPFNTLAHAGQVENMAQTLASAAARHPTTAGHELAVVLPDPAGYAAELNALRLARFELARQELAKPENAHPLVSLQMRDGLRQSVVDEQEARSAEAVTPLMNGGAFRDIMRVRPNPRGWPEGTRWEPLTDRQELLMHGPGMGRVVLPDHEARAQRWAMEATERNWRRYSRYLDQSAISAWRTEFEAKMTRDHGQPQERLERDWMAALHHPGLAVYLQKHFDDQDPNRPGTARDHSPGEAYAQEVARAWTPAPLSPQASLHQRYQTQLEKSPQDADAWLWHALLGNQSELKSSVAQYLLDNRNDKLHDLSAAFFTSLREGEQVHPALLKHGWLIRPGFVAASLSITQSWASLISTGLATVPVAGASLMGLSADLQRRLFASLTVARTVALAGQSAVQQSALRRPLLVEIELSLQEARALMDNRRAAGADALSNSQLKRMAGQVREGRIRLQLATDTVEARAAGLQPQDLAASGVGSVTAGGAARAALAAATPGTLRVSEEVFGKLLQSSANWQKRALDLTQELGRAMPGVTLTLDGQIGLLGMWINGMGVLSNWQKYERAAWGASLTQRLGAQAARGTVSIAALQAIGSVAGAASGFSLTVGQGIKAYRSFSSEATTVGYAYALSTGTALGFTSASGIVAWGAVSGLMNRRLGTQGALGWPTWRSDGLAPPWACGRWAARPWASPAGA
ncbi:MAG: hypothetical protein MUF44_12300 [Hydrogenophaga sp.]|nr:hypothetical protein [Hydrogenophaga sp.]